MNINEIDTYVHTAKSAGDLQLINELVKFQIDLTKEYAEPEYTLSLNGIDTLPIGDIQAIKAKSKNGKTYLASILLASFFGCKKFGFTSKITGGHAMFIDTEQNELNTARVVRRVHALCGWDINTNNDCFKSYALRTMDSKDRMKFVENALDTERPQMVIIDGIGDLIEDFNDIVSSSECINNLMRMSTEYHCAIISILHTNKAKEDSNMKGHLGTFLLQKSSDVFEVKKDKDTFNVSETDCRNMPVDGFSFTIDYDGMPHLIYSCKDQELSDTLYQIMGNGTMSHRELKELLMNKLNRSERMARYKISEALNKGLLTKISNIGQNVVYQWQGKLP
jgi:hypothetical protein